MWLTSNISCPLEFYASFQDNIREYTMETDSDEMIRLVGENTRFAAREIASEPEFAIQTLHSRLQTMSSLCIASMYIDVQNLKIWSPLISIINYSIYLIFKIFLSRINLFLPFFFLSNFHDDFILLKRRREKRRKRFKFMKQLRPVLFFPW